MVPHLQTALQGPLGELEEHLINSNSAIERWFRAELMEQTPPFYSSVDLRNSGFKIAPIDTNLFPGGWNNISLHTLPLAEQATLVALEKYCPDVRKLLIIPENHTRNTFYLDNVVRLKEIFTKAGIETRIGTINPEIKQTQSFTTANGKTILLEPVIRTSYRLKLADFDPCTILINNDLSAGIKPVLNGLFEQYVIPPLHAGWYTRKKSTHAKYYDLVAKRFAKTLEFDPWLINTLFTSCDELNFVEQTGLDTLKDKASDLLKAIRKKYKEYGISNKPFIIAKADNGTYGMGIMTIHDPKELEQLNRRTRNKMGTIKEGQQVDSLILQEGVLTIETINSEVAEPVVYMLDRFVVGAFYRANALRGVEENLNSKGAYFEPMQYSQAFMQATKNNAITDEPNRFYSYGVIARLAMLAAADELEHTNPEPLNYAI